MRRVPFFRSFAVLLAGAACVLGAHAQSYPAKPVHLLVSNTAGSTPDVLARYFSTRLADAWKQPVVVENRAGAGGIVAADVVSKDLSVNNIHRQFDLAQGDDGRREVIECQEGVLQLLIAHQ